MSFYTKASIKFFGDLSDKVSFYFPDLRNDLRRARLKMSVQEHLSKGMFLSFIFFLITLPFLSFLFSFFLQSFLFGFITSFTVSFFLTLLLFLLYIHYPRVLIKQKAGNIEKNLPFASLYIATIASSKLPIHTVFNIFTRFSEYGEITEEIAGITNDIEAFGIDVNTAIERAVERSSSKKMKELLWGILSITRTGGDLTSFLKEKSKSFMEEYRRKLFEFSHQLTMFIEVYITAVVLGAIFFVILTAIMSGIAGAAGNIIAIQSFLIFVFLPIVSFAFIILVKSISPGGE
ncbi:MAG: type II secretion system F family protein [Candidatus Aenigmatarchaeota archaeon]